MKVYNYQSNIKNIDFTNSIYLAGPSIRDGETPWRQNAISEFSNFNFSGNIIIPEKAENLTFDQIFNWEIECMERVSKILFWIPRDLDILPGFTTNVEFGLYVGKDKVYPGSPKDAPKTRYLIKLNEYKNGNIWSHDLKSLVYICINK